jgi:hypothetical protein
MTRQLDFITRWYGSITRRYDFVLTLVVLVTVVVLGAVAACGGRTIGSRGDGDGDGAVPPDGTVMQDARPPVDGQVGDPCAPYDAEEALTLCDDPSPLRGWAWDGDCCKPIHCVCVGEDCDRLHATQAACLGAHAPECFTPSTCDSLAYNECDERPDCEIVFYGGGCFNEAECDPDGGDPDNWMCVDQAYACVPFAHTCNERDELDCGAGGDADGDDDCFWVAYEFELCFEACCIPEGYGYCSDLSSLSYCGCAPQEIHGCMDPCASVAGYSWDGSFCQPIICCCEGPDCAETWATAEECWDARETCPTNECGEARGYCMYGDAEQPVCWEGFGTDWQWNYTHPGVCGMGVCCTPCPDESDAGVWYASHDPVECEGIDIDCWPDVSNSFYSECGCGCVDPG